MGVQVASGFDAIQPEHVEGAGLLPGDPILAGMGDLDRLWESVEPGREIFTADRIASLSADAQRYLSHAIAEGTVLARAVRLRMEGEIKLKNWAPFRAEQVITINHEMIWRATARMGGLPISGYDRLLDGAGEMKWKLLGLIPVMSATGGDVTRSAKGRLAAESIWLPSMLCESPWNENRAHVKGMDVEFGIAESGRLESVSLERWSDFGGESYRDQPFGGVVEEERAFGGYTMPSHVRVGWFFGSDRFESEGEFFRAEVTSAEFR